MPAFTFTDLGSTNTGFPVDVVPIRFQRLCRIAPLTAGKKARKRISLVIGKLLGSGKRIASGGFEPPT
jgi:hypothetical protein